MSEVTTEDQLDVAYAPAEAVYPLRGYATRYSPPVTHPLGGDSAAVPAVIPDLPDPTIGGQPGPSRLVAWSEGLQPDRTLHARLTGGTAELPYPTPETVGPVGVLDWRGKLLAGVRQQYSQITPDSQRIAEQILGVKLGTDAGQG